MLTLRDNNNELILKEDFLELKWDTEANMLLAAWSGWLDSKKGQKGCLQVVEAVKTYQAKYILNDNSLVTGHSGDTNWMNVVWFPALKEAGLKYFAWVYSPEFFTQLQIDNTVDNTKGIAIRTFLTFDEARQWLLMQ